MKRRQVFLSINLLVGLENEKKSIITVYFKCLISFETGTISDCRRDVSYVGCFFFFSHQTLIKDTSHWVFFTLAIFRPGVFDSGAW